MFADSQKEAKANTGSIGDWEGNKLMIIPQTLKSGTFELALDDSKLFIMGGDVKPIKLEFIGDTRTDMDTTGKKYNDMTVKPTEGGKFLRTKTGLGAKVQRTGFPEKVARELVKQTGDKYAVPAK